MRIEPRAHTDGGLEANEGADQHARGFGRSPRERVSGGDHAGVGTTCVAPNAVECFDELDLMAIPGEEVRGGDSGDPSAQDQNSHPLTSGACGRAYPRLVRAAHPNASTTPSLEDATMGCKRYRYRCRRGGTVTDTAITFDRILGRRVRLGSWQDQKISTYRKIHEALDEGAWDEAAKLGSYFIDEANVCFSIYRQWLPDLSAFLADSGVDQARIRARSERATELNRLPDGSDWDRNWQWDRFISAMERFTAAAYREERDLAKELMAAAKELWRQCHDRDVDHTYALMSLVKEELGEPAIRAMYDRVLLPLFAWRYEKFDIDKHPWDEGLEALMLVACEAMRGHLVGPERTGDFELIETEDRFILRFDPCGSGQRTIRGDVIEGTPPRMEPPYGWTVTEEPHTWNHSTPGVCLYCVHCIVLMEEMPMDRFGYPVRVIDPPTYPDTNASPGERQRCQWQMFKDPTQVPAEYYERVGRIKPKVFGSIAHGAETLDVNVTGYPGAG